MLLNECYIHNCHNEINFIHRFRNRCDCSIFPLRKLATVRSVRSPATNCPSHDKVGIFFEKLTGSVLKLERRKKNFFRFIFICFFFLLKRHASFNFAIKEISNYTLNPKNHLSQGNSFQFQNLKTWTDRVSVHSIKNSIS